MHLEFPKAVVQGISVRVSETGFFSAEKVKPHPSRTFIFG